MKYLLCVLAVAAVPLALGSLRSSSGPDLIWWTTHALNKVRPYDAAPASLAQSVRVSTARNEFEPFQIVLRAGAHDIDGVDVQLTHFRGPNGRVLPKGNITVYLERFVDVKIPSSVEGGMGEWPDPLVPQVDRYEHEKRNAFPFRLVHGRNQPLWIEVYTPPSTDPGSYHGEVQISIAGDPKIRVPVDLEVWNFVLPSTSSLVTSFGFSGTRALNQHYGKYTNDHQLYALSGLYRKAALWHRISIHGGSGVPPAVSLSNGQVRLNWDAFDRELAPALDGRMFSEDEPLYGAKATSVGVRTAPSLKTSGQQIQYWQRVAEHFRKKGWIDRLFNYLWDEPKPSEYDAMIRLGKAVHQAGPQLRNLVTAPLHREWAGVVDI